MIEVDTAEHGVFKTSAETIGTSNGPRPKGGDVEMTLDATEFRPLYLYPPILKRSPGRFPPMQDKSRMKRASARTYIRT